MNILHTPFELVDYTGWPKIQ